MTDARIASIDDNRGEPFGTSRKTSERPIFVGRDFAEREWATAGSGPSVRRLVDHDPDERDLVYACGARTGRLKCGLYEAHGHGWRVGGRRRSWMVGGSDAR